MNRPLRPAIPAATVTTEAWPFACRTCGIHSHKTKQTMPSKIESTVDEKQQNSHVDIAPVRRDDDIGQRR